MKKLNLFLCAAFIMAASAMFAQTTIYTENPFYVSPPNQWATQVNPVAAPDKADCADCTIPQIQGATFNGIFTENMNLMNQTGDHNDANVFQTGAKNYSVINQDGETINTDGFYNDAQVYQAGLSNYSDVAQHGEHNTGDVIQMGDENYAKQLVGDGNAEYNIAYVRQDGDRNASSQTQYYDGNDAKIEQLTNDNEATQLQTSTDTHTLNTGNVASIWQYGGDSNAAKQVQTGTKNFAYAEQSGTGNISLSTQIGSRVLESNYSSTLQIGDSNLACVDQKATPGGFNGSAIYQLGISNKAGVTQDTNAANWGNISYISQYGNFNNACATQLNGLSNL